jgi:hypothetical protein
MAAGNAESVANGVTGVGGIEVQTHQFRDSNLIWYQRVSFFRPLSPVTPLALRSRLPFLVRTTKARLRKRTNLRVTTLPFIVVENLSKYKR